MGHGDRIVLSRERNWLGSRFTAHCQIGLVAWLTLAFGNLPGWATPPDANQTSSARSATEEPAECGTSGESLFRLGLRPNRKTAPDGPKSAPVPRPNREDITARLRRRLEVCDRIKVIAIETGDVRLEAGASEVETLVWQWYLEESSRANKKGRGPSPTAAKPNGTSGAQALPERSLFRAESQEFGSVKTGVPNRSSGFATEGVEPRNSQTPSPAAMELQHRLDRRDIHTIRGTPELDPVNELQPTTQQSTSPARRNAAPSPETLP